MELVFKLFEELTVDELYSILGARSEVFVNEQNIVYQDMDGIDRHAAHLFIVENGTVAAYLRIIDAGVKYPEMSIGRVLTLKPFRHRGYCRKLMQTALDYAAENGKPVRIEAQSYLKEFYMELGFKPISGEFILEGISHIEMLYCPDHVS